MTSPRQFDVAWLRALSNATPYGVVAIDAGGLVEFASDRALELLDLDPASNLDDVSARLLRTTGARTLSEISEISDHRRTPGIDDDEMTESSTLGVRAIAIDDGRRGRLLLLSDSGAIEELRTTLRIASRDPGLTHFDARVVHDLKAPLNVLALHLELIKRSLTSYDATISQGITKSLDVMKHEVQRLDRMLLDALDVAVEHEGTLQRPFDVSRILARFAELVAPLCQHQDVVVVLDVPRTALVVFGDPGKLKQVLLKLTLHALEAMTGPGRIDLSAHAVDGQVRIQLGDTGPGLGQDVLESLSSATRVPTSAVDGIGLAVVRTLIEGLGGRIRAENRAVRGCEYTIELPNTP